MARRKPATPGTGSRRTPPAPKTPEVVEFPTITVAPKVLGDALDVVGKAASTGTALPALACARLVVENNVVTISATDLDTTIVATFEADASTDGEFLVPARLMATICKEFGDEAITLEAMSDHVAVTAGEFAGRVATYPPAEQPLPAVVEGDTHVIDGKLVARAIARVVGSLANDPNRPVLTNVCIDTEDGHLRMAATDSYRLAVIDVPKEKAFAASPILMPGGFAKIAQAMLAKTEAAEVTVGPTAIALTVDGAILSCKLWDGEYPSYRRLEKPTSTTVTVERQPLVAAIRRCRLMLATNEALRLNFDDGKITVSTPRAENAVEVVEATLEGAPIEVGLNAKLLVETLASAGGESVVFRLADGHQPLVVHAEGDDDARWLLMPTRVIAATEDNVAPIRSQGEGGEDDSVTEDGEATPAGEGMIEPEVKPEAPAEDAVTTEDASV